VRSVDEDFLNIFLLNFEGDIPDGVIDAVTPFLQSEKRGKFHLSAPNVNLDLSSVLPVVLCDGKNSQKLSGVCDIIELAPLNNKEMAEIIAGVIEDKKRAYNLSQLNLTDDATTCLKNMTADDIEKCIDKAIRAGALKSDNLLLDGQIISLYADNSKTNHIGFGGTEK
jgi:hypothetical protein